MKFVWGLIFYVFSISAFAECGPEAPRFTQEFMTQMLPLARNRGLLFSATKEGSVAWVYGTLHVAKPEWSIPGPYLRKLFVKPPYLALEVDLLNASTQQVIRQEAVTRTPGGMRLSSELTNIAVANCVDAAVIATGNRSTVISAIEANQARLQGLYPEYGIDIVLAGAARARHIVIEELESAHGRMNLEEGADAANLEPSPVKWESALAGDKVGKALMTVAEGWANASVSALEKSAYYKNVPREIQRERASRNHHLAEAIDKLVVARGTGGVVAIGVLHLVGEGNTLHYLEKNGYKISRIY